MTTAVPTSAILSHATAEISCCTDSLDWPFPIRRFTVEEYERIAEVGILTEDDSVELLEGLIVEKMTKNPRHDATIDALVQLLNRLLPEGWFLRIQNVLITTDSAPEPDLAIVRGSPLDYGFKHPHAEHVDWVAEVAETSLSRDRQKRRIYARANIPNYWIFDLSANRIEIHGEPDTSEGVYRTTQIVDLLAPATLTLSNGALITLPLDTALKFR
jgi:Uma2 family endonuclease